MELKFIKTAYFYNLISCSNRTFMELKLDKSNDVARLDAF